MQRNDRWGGLTISYTQIVDHLTLVGVQVGERANRRIVIVI